MSSQAIEFPVFSLEFIVDPYPTIALLRERDPVHHLDDMRAWFVTRHEDVKRLLSDTDALTSDPRAWEGHVAPRGRHVRWYLDHTLMALDRDDHYRLRRLVAATGTEPNGPGWPARTARVPRTSSSA